MTWKGNAGMLGWAGASPGLDPTFRGPAAWLFGHRFLRLGQPEQARAFFAVAAKETAADSSWHQAAAAELARLPATAPAVPPAPPPAPGH